ncbi:PTS sugar transporter subunit IIA [Pasteurella atlantica]|uniref:PTS sugar transporter subunit IIA n=1 Tax=Pasteurellaceae TaxID=712 RepID=UPI00276433E7|nr:PTS sugar transporter subunit IIA [Pasteurella atlantica]MDP8033131.1 PTS sugar transporter subunit IIA [Pasteurella atlantica]MDP8035068.1 PTS sugar transporter subunit IIA [Pasteurella atlantica]MDP8036972.1 PTS sugar transporter subunit IIA [Pasteurella atlantica]MDP8047502.1 PTS sugar transporter subunit IIA [Pasteurella atlantica]MDP8049171.1 PTS sugar transporter subunit IIA [Pasteurella atlantica]
MKLTKYLKPELIRVGVHISSKKRALEIVGSVVTDYLIQHFSENYDVSAIDCFSCLCKREKLGSTCINYGIAVPHTKLPNWNSDEPIAVFLQLENPIDYETIENKEIDLIFAMIFPDKENDEYKKDLQEIVTILNNKQLAKSLRTAESEEDVWNILETADSEMCTALQDVENQDQIKSMSSEE